MFYCIRYIRDTLCGKLQFLIRATGRVQLEISIQCGMVPHFNCILLLNGDLDTVASIGFALGKIHSDHPIVHNPAKNRWIIAVDGQGVIGALPHIIHHGHSAGENAVHSAAIRQVEVYITRIAVKLDPIRQLSRKNTAIDNAVVLGQLSIIAALDAATVQHHIAVSAALHTNAIVVVSVDIEFACDRAIQQINNVVTIGILDGHIAADRAVQNVLCFCIFNAGNGQPGGFVIAPAGTRRCLGQTVRADLDLDHHIGCFLVRANILMLVLRAISDAVGLFRRRGRKPHPCICKCGYREDGEHHTECQYHAHDAFFHDILSFVG